MPIDPKKTALRPPGYDKTLRLAQAVTLGWDDPPPVIHAHLWLGTIPAKLTLVRASSSGYLAYKLSFPGSTPLAVSRALESNGVHRGLKLYSDCAPQEYHGYPSMKHIRYLQFTMNATLLRALERSRSGSTPA